MVTNTEDIMNNGGDDDNDEGERDDGKDEEREFIESSKMDENGIITVEVSIDNTVITGPSNEGVGAMKINLESASNSVVIASKTTPDEVNNTCISGPRVALGMWEYSLLDVECDRIPSWSPPDDIIGDTWETGMVLAWPIATGVFEGNSANTPVALLLLVSTAFNSKTASNTGM